MAAKFASFSSKSRFLAVAVLASLALTGSAAAGQVAAYEVIDGVSIPKALTDAPGDAKRGREVAINRKQGNCLACHKLPIPEQPFHGEVGPDLSEVGGAYSAGELRLRIVDPKALNPGTIMPSFYKTEGLNRVAKEFQGKTILTAQQVEDIIAYLVTLK